MVFKSKFADVKPDEKYKDLLSNLFWDKLDEYKTNVLFVDYESRRQWTGAQIKTTSARLARQLLKHGMKPNDDCVMFYKHNDYIQLTALGVLFAGGSICAGYHLDPEQEHAYMLDVIKPSFVFVGHELASEMLRLRSNNQHSYKIVIMDDDEHPKGCGAPKGACAEHQVASDRTGQNNHSYDNHDCILGLHRDLLSETDSAGAGLKQLEPANSQTPSSSCCCLPVQVDPSRPTFVLLTSGSTGRPKPVCRSQRNSLYTCHSLIGAQELWDLNESSVVAAHLALDHGTGIFQLKQCLAQGFKSIIINGYELTTMLDAIKTYRITDLVLGSALVHNMLSSNEVHNLLTTAAAAEHKDNTGLGLLHEQLGSLRNLLAVGSPIASQSVVDKFMSRLPECSVRQAFGMTECGFLCVVPRELALRNHHLDKQIVGCMMPNIEFKLVHRPSPGVSNSNLNTASTAGKESQEDHELQGHGREITEFDQQGELYVRGPTVSPGYLGEQFLKESRANFLPDGYYKSNDICSMGSNGMLRVYGRFSEVLCLSDGWKVLPSEIEQTIMEHPFVKEATVVGIPHPNLPTCHAPRAYIVPRDGVNIIDHDTNNQIANNNNNNQPEQPYPGARKTISKRLIFDFVAERVSEPKRLIGGIKFVDELPRIALGKIDKKSLKKADGY